MFVAFQHIATLLNKQVSRLYWWQTDRQTDRSTDRFSKKIFV